MPFLDPLNLHSVPDNLPVPVDDGAAQHLVGLSLPAIELASTAGRLVDLTGLSDADGLLTDALRLPTFEVNGERLLKRLTMIVRDGRIAACFYPIFPSDADVSAVLAWLRAAASSQAEFDVTP